MPIAVHFSGVLRSHDTESVQWVHGHHAFSRQAENQEFQTAWHGEFTNLPLLCKDLDLPQDTPVDRVLWAGWTRWARTLFARLEGIFALAVFAQSELFLYRDRSGLRNLFYGPLDQRHFGFASDLQSLLQLRGGAVPVARQALHEYLRFGDISAPHTLYQDVFALEPGHLFYAKNGSYGKPTDISRQEQACAPISFSDTTDELETQLRLSIRSSLTGSNRPAAFLSGGVDSALICALAVQERDDLTAVTVGFDGQQFDETPVASRIARHLGLPHQILRFSQPDYISALDRLAQRCEQPMADPASLPTLLALDHCRSHFDLILDGTGADEAIGMLPPRHVRLATGYASRLSSPLRSAVTTLLRATPGLAGYAAITDFEHPADTMIRWQGFARWEVEKLCSEPVSFEHTHFYQTFERSSASSHYDRYTALLNAMPCERLTQAMLISDMRVRFPFWAKSTEQFIRQLPTSFKHSENCPKRILRELLARHVPPAIWDAPKHSFDFPLLRFLRANDHAVVRKHLDAACWREWGILREDAVVDIARQFMGGDQRLSFRVWSLVVLGAWLQQHPTNIKP